MIFQIARIKFYFCLPSKTLISVSTQKFLFVSSHVKFHFGETDLKKEACYFIYVALSERRFRRERYQDKIKLDRTKLENWITG